MLDTHVAAGTYGLLRCATVSSRDANFPFYSDPAQPGNTPVECLQRDLPNIETVYGSQPYAFVAAVDTAVNAAGNTILYGANGPEQLDVAKLATLTGLGKNQVRLIGCGEALARGATCLGSSEITTIGCEPAVAPRSLVISLDREVNAGGVDAHGTYYCFDGGAMSLGRAFGAYYTNLVAAAASNVLEGGKRDEQAVAALVEALGGYVHEETVAAHADTVMITGTLVERLFDQLTATDSPLREDFEHSDSTLLLYPKRNLALRGALQLARQIAA